MDQNEVEFRARIDQPVEKNNTKIDSFSTDAEIVKSYSGLDANFKRRVTQRMNKAMTGVDGAKSKQLLPEATYTTGYGIFDVVIPPYNLDELAFFYENSSANHAAVNAKVSNVVGLGYHFIPSSATLDKLDEAESQDALTRAQRKVERAKTQTEEWLEEMNDEDTFTNILEKAMIDAEATGNGYLEIGRKVTGEIGYVGHIPATTIRVRRNRDGYVQIVGQKVVFFRNFGDTTTPNPITSDTRPNELIHIKVYSPKNSYYGVPDTVASAVSMVGNELAGKYNVDYFENKAVPRYIIVTKGAKLSDASEDRMFQFLQGGLRGQNHRTLYIPLPGDTDQNKVDFDMKPIESGIQDGSFDRYRKANKEDILMAHQVPQSKVGGGAGMAIAASLASDRTFKEQVCRPKQRMLEKLINKIIKEKTDIVKFKFNELSLTDELAQSQIDERYLRNQVIVPNEVRSRIGLPIRQDGNDVLQMNAQQRAEQNAQANNSRQRDQQREANASDSPNTISGRNAQGEGRSAP